MLSVEGDLTLSGPEESEIEIRGRGDLIVVQVKDLGTARQALKTDSFRQGLLQLIPIANALGHENVRVDVEIGGKRVFRSAGLGKALLNLARYVKLKS